MSSLNGLTQASSTDKVTETITLAEYQRRMDSTIKWKQAARDLPTYIAENAALKYELEQAYKVIDDQQQALAEQGTAIMRLSRLDTLQSSLIAIDEKLLRMSSTKPKNWAMTLGVGVIYGFKPLGANYGITLSFGRTFFRL